jgi:hypothetical protein
VRSVVAGLWSRPWRPSKDHIAASANRSSPSARSRPRPTHRLSARAAVHAAPIPGNGRASPPRRMPISIAFRSPWWMTGRAACAASGIAARPWSGRSG